MKRLLSWSVVLALLALIGMTQGSSATMGERIDSDLAQILEDTPAHEKVPVLVLLGERADIDALKADLARSGTKRAERHLRVIETLQAKANDSQGGLLAYLRWQKLLRRVEDVRPFWIDNMVALKARAQGDPAPRVEAGRCAHLL